MDQVIRSLREGPAIAAAQAPSHPTNPHSYQYQYQYQYPYPYPYPYPYSYPSSYPYPYPYPFSPPQAIKARAMEEAEVHHGEG